MNTSSQVRMHLSDQFCSWFLCTKVESLQSLKILREDLIAILTLSIYEFAFPNLLEL